MKLNRIEMFFISEPLAVSLPAIDFFVRLRNLTLIRERPQQGGSQDRCEILHREGNILQTSVFVVLSARSKSAF
jgi:hypothetical protein